MVIGGYERRVSPTGATANVMGDVQAAGATGRAIAGLGAQAIGLTKDFFEKKDKLRRQADAADYETSKLNLMTDIENARAKAMQDGRIAYGDIEQKVVTPLVNKFKADMVNRGYGDDSLGAFQQDFQVEEAKIAAKEAGLRNTREISDYVERIKGSAFAKINNGATEEGNAELDTLVDAIGQKKVNELKSLGVYNKNMNSITSASNPDQVNDILNSDEVKGMEPNQFQALKSYGNTIIGRMVKDTYAPIKEEMDKMIKNGELTIDYVIASDLPDNEKKLYENAINRSIDIGAGQNPELVGEGMEMVDDFLDGRYGGKKSADDYNDLLEDLDKLELPLDVVTRMLEPITASQRNGEKSSAFFINKKEYKQYDKVEDDILMIFRDEFNEVMSSAPASVRNAQFGVGYSSVYKWLSDNKSKIKSGELDAKDAVDHVKSVVGPMAIEQIKANKRKKNETIKRVG